MTVIAWDGQMLAADRQVTCGDTISSTTKVFCMGRSLVGISGNLSMAMEMLEWLKADAEPAAFRQEWRDPEKGPVLMLITHDRRVWKYESSPFPFEIHDRAVAAGSGMSIALALMNAGLDASTAVIGTQQVVNSCGCGVDVLYLHPEQLTN